MAPHNSKRSYYPRGRLLLPCHGRNPRNEPMTEQAEAGEPDGVERGLARYCRWTFADLHSSAGAWIILALSALITLAAWHISNTSVMQTAELRFRYQTEDIVSAIKERMLEQEVALWGGVGLFEASEQVTRDEWFHYVESLQLGKYLPGLQGYGYAEFVSPEDRADFVNRIRKEGFPEFDIKPSGKRDLYSSIIFLEPFRDRNLRAFGYDMWSEPTRREGMIRARDTGAPAMSGMVTLVQETDSDVQRGFLLYLPVYRKAMPTKTAAERRAAIKGYVYSPFRIKDLMHGILGKGDTEIDFRIYDGESISGESIMYDSAGNYSGGPNTNSSQFSLSSRVVVGGHPWTLVFRSRDGFIPAGDANEPLMVAGVGIVIDILLFLTILSLSNQRRRAQLLANTMTSKLRQAKEMAESAAEAELVLRMTAQKSNEKLKAANQGLMRFASIVAHDLRAPLKRIEAFVGILGNEYADGLDDDGRDLLSRITRASTRMRGMLDSMHEYSKCSNLTLEGKTVCLEAVVKNALDNLNPDLVDCEIKLDFTQACWVKGDVNLLAHVVQNLLSNSIKFRSEAGPVIIFRARAIDADYVELEVTDNGIGIEQEYADRVFEMFTRLHGEDEYEGTGIGLAICKKIITDHGGDISIDAAHKGGTRVLLTLLSAQSLEERRTRRQAA